LALNADKRRPNVDDVEVIPVQPRPSRRPGNAFPSSGSRTEGKDRKKKQNPRFDPVEAGGSSNKKESKNVGPSSNLPTPHLLKEPVVLTEKPNPSVDENNTGHAGKDEGNGELSSTPVEDGPNIVPASAKDLPVESGASEVTNKGDADAMGIVEEGTPATRQEDASVVAQGAWGVEVLAGDGHVVSRAEAPSTADDDDPTEAPINSPPSVERAVRETDGVNDNLPVLTLAPVLHEIKVVETPEQNQIQHDGVPRLDGKSVKKESQDRGTPIKQAGVQATDDDQEEVTLESPSISALLQTQPKVGLLCHV
jgi:hypothetical protein